MQREISAIFGKGKVVLRETGRAVTPYGGVAVLAEYLKKIGYVERVREAMPIESKSPNAIPPVDIYPAFLVAVVAGARAVCARELVARRSGAARAAGDQAVSDRRHGAESVQEVYAASGV